MSPEITAVIFGLLAAALWGSGDFSGGVTTKRTPVLSVLILSQITGLVLMLVIILVRGETVPSALSLIWACAAGIAGGIGVAALYQALAMGQMGIAAPVAAVFTALIPVLISMITEGLPSVIQLAGFALALLGIWILSQHGTASANRRGLGLAVLAGVGFGLLLVALDRAGSTGSVFWPLAAARLASILFMTAIALARRHKWKIERGVLPGIMIAGVFDVFGNAAYVVASQVGRLAVAAVLSSLYPAATVILASILLKERTSRRQVIAIGIVLLAIILIINPF
jgi:uncharacterized membrane protein